MWWLDCILGCLFRPTFAYAFDVLVVEKGSAAIAARSCQAITTIRGAKQAVVRTRSYSLSRFSVCWEAINQATNKQSAHIYCP